MEQRALLAANIADGMTASESKYLADEVRRKVREERDAFLLSPEFARKVDEILQRAIEGIEERVALGGYKLMFWFNTEWHKDDAITDQAKEYLENLGYLITVIHSEYIWEGNIPIQTCQGWVISWDFKDGKQILLNE